MRFADMPTSFLNSSVTSRRNRASRRALFLAYAYRATGDAKYRQAVAEAFGVDDLQALAGQTEGEQKTRPRNAKCEVLQPHTIGGDGPLEDAPHLSAGAVSRRNKLMCAHRSRCRCCACPTPSVCWRQKQTISRINQAEVGNWQRKAKRGSTPRGTIPSADLKIQATIESARVRVTVGYGCTWRLPCTAAPNWPPIRTSQNKLGHAVTSRQAEPSVPVPILSVRRPGGRSACFERSPAPPLDPTAAWP